MRMRLCGYIPVGLPGLRLFCGLHNDEFFSHYSRKTRAIKLLDEQLIYNDELRNNVRIAAVVQLREQYLFATYCNVIRLIKKY